MGAHFTFSFSSVILIASAVLVGPAGAAFVGWVAILAPASRIPRVARVFNAAMYACTASLAGLVYLLSGGPPRIADVRGPGPLLLDAGLPLIVADVAMCLMNAILLSGVMQVSSGIPFRTQVGKLLTTTGLTYVGYGVIGFLFVVLWVPAGVGWFSAILVLAPLFVARWAIVQYGDEQRSHARTLSALVTAAEAKDPSSKGHSTRVARLSEWMAESLSLGHQQIEDVRTAGMLHDLGMVAVPTRIVRSSEVLSPQDQAILAEHPSTGVEMIKGIGFVRDSLDGIAHHHERFDGRGYPDGVGGQQIPLTARIIAAADVFDALTTDRPGRPAFGVDEALEQVRGRSNEHLDPAVVNALERAVRRHAWEPLRKSREELASMGAGVRHDDPETSDQLANHGVSRTTRTT